MSNFETLQTFLESLEDEYGVKGASVSVMHHGREVFRSYVGTAKDDGTPVTEATLFRWYSMSKPITVIAALQLMEQGKFEMQEPVGKYLPAFWGMNVAALKPSGAYGWWNPPAKRAMTIRDLMTMTAGITYGGMNHPAEIALSAAYDKLKAETGNAYTTRQFADMVAQCPLMFEPGSHWNYSYCLDVVGALIEVWSGKTFGEYLKEAVFEPLGMKDAAFYLPEDKKKNLSDFWEQQADGTARVYSEEQRPMETGSCFESGGAGLIGSLDDYRKFAWMLANGGVSEDGKRIVSRRSIELMRTNHLNETQLVDYDWETLGGYGYGLGVRTLMDPTVTGALSHVGEFGWNGMPGCYVMADPAEELSVVYMQQLYPSHELEIQLRLRNIIYHCLDKE